MKTRDIDILGHILIYCEDIQKSVDRFGKDQEVFERDKDYRNSVCMSLLQIGELAGLLTEGFRSQTNDRMYWPAIKGMRNLLAHNYGAVDVQKVWETVMDDIPPLLQFCRENIEAEKTE